MRTKQSGQKGWPRLSETLQPITDLGTCQACGAQCGIATRWEEHDDQDQPAKVLVLLCQRCGDAMIDAHPRLYRKLHHHEPWPGAMPTCIGCPWHQGAACDHPDQLTKGGTGLMLRMPPPMVCHVKADRASRSGFMKVWMGPVTCLAKEAITKGTVPESNQDRHEE